MSVTVTINGAVATVTIDNPPVNAASHAVRHGLADALAQTEAVPEIKVVLLICAGRTFIAGADIREFAQPPKDPSLPDVVTALESATKPWIAAIHGTALGGGLEIALGCHYRIASASVKLGLPEVNLGLIPGAGGTVRLPRVTGVLEALDMMATGKPINAERALSHGLIDAVAAGDLGEFGLEFARSIVGKPLPVATSKRTLAPVDPDALNARIVQIKAKARGQNSPVAICDAVENTIALSAIDALAAERALFTRLKDDPQSLALRHIFFAERAAGRVDAAKNVPGPALNRIGVVGGGTMGAGIAAACLLAGLAVTMIERDPAALQSGQERVAGILDNSKKRGLISEATHDEILTNFVGSIQYSALGKADIVIEAVFEDLAVKHQVFAELDQHVSQTAVLASNTSYLDISKIAEGVADPSRVIGLHFFSPAHIMKLLELVVPDGASPEAIAAGLALGKRLRKITVAAGVCDGFIGNRIMSTYRRACDYLIEDGAMPQDVDAAMRNFGFGMGIFEMQDLAGLDIGWAMRKRKAATRDPAERYVDIADKLCEDGRLGRKTQRGWYRYEADTAIVDPDVEALILAESARKGITRGVFGEDEIMAQIIAVMQSEGDAILAEGIASKASDIDVVMVNGYGFPRWRGGPMFMKDKGETA